VPEFKFYKFREYAAGGLVDNSSK